MQHTPRAGREGVANHARTAPCQPRATDHTTSGSAPASLIPPRCPGREQPHDATRTTASGRQQGATLTAPRPPREDHPVSHTDTLPAPPKALSATTMCEALLTTAAERPGQVALCTPDDSVVLTYGQLTQRVA